MSLLRFPSRAFDKPLPPVPSEGVGAFCVTFDAKWLPYLLGAAGVLCAGGTWESEKERCISEGMTLLAALMTGEFCQPSPEPGDSGIELGDCMGCCIRWNNGVLEVFSCGVWTPVPGAAGNGFEPTQPGAGAPQPQPNGGTAEYCGALSGLNKYYLPTTVNTGDVITFSRLLGSWNDGVEVVWHCPDGWLFVAGSCFQEPLYNGGTDPLPGTMHMSIVASIAGDFYDVLNLDGSGNPQPFTVPAGYTNAPVIVQANVDYGGQIYGEVTFCVDVTNNQPGTFTHEFDLTKAPTPFHVTDPIPGWTPPIGGVWVPGEGWRENTSSNYPTSPNDSTTIDIIATFSHITLTSAVLYYDLVKGTEAAGSTSGLYFDRLGSTVASDTTASDTNPDGNGKTFLIPLGSYDVDDIQVHIQSNNAAHGSGTPGTIRAYRLVVTGIGIDPWLS